MVAMVQQVRKLFTVNWPAKIVALLLAVATWFYLFYETLEQFGPREVPLEIVVPDPERYLVLEVGEPEPPHRKVDQVRVTLEGPRGTRGDVALRGLRVRHSLDEVALIGAFGVPIPVELRPDDLALLPAGFRIHRLEPSVLRVVVDERAEKLMTLRRRLGDLVEGAPDESCELVEAKPSVTELTVVGPKSVLERHGEIGIRKIRIDGRRSSFMTQAKLEATLDGRPVSSPNHVFVEVILREKPSERLLANVPLTVLVPVNFPTQHLELSPDKLDALVRGPASLVDQLVPGDLSLEVDLSRVALERPSDVKAGFRENFPVLIRFRRPDLAEPLRVELSPVEKVQVEIRKQ